MTFDIYTSMLLIVTYEPLMIPTTPPTLSTLSILPLTSPWMKNELPVHVPSVISSESIAPKTPPRPPVRSSLSLTPETFVPFASTVTLSPVISPVLFAGS